MLLQTFVQLNILLLAAPALAGWAALPVTNPMLTQAAQIVLLPIVRQAETSPQATEDKRTPQPKASPRPLIAQRFVIVSRLPQTTQAAFSALVSDAVSLCNPFPHAARAP